MTEFTGEFWRKGDAGFEDAATARLFNSRRPSRRPMAVLRAAHTTDVAAGVRLAAAQGWKVAVRAGGHSWDAWSLREDTLLIDLVQFSGMSYDPASGIVAVGPAVRGGLDLDPYLAAHGRFFPVGHSPTVGLGGFLLQGGIGWNCRGWGWAAEAIDSMDVVTATGELVRCSETENADLFWAARGGGPGFFGVVTEFRLRTRPRFAELIQSSYVYPADLASEVLTWYHTARHDLPPSVELAAVACTTPGLDRPVLIIDAVSFDGGPTSLAALGACPVAGKALTAKVAQPVRFTDLCAEQLRANPEQHRYFADNAFLTGSSAELVAALLPAFTDLPTARTFTMLGDFSPLWSRRPPDMAVSLPSDLYFAAYVIGQTTAEDAHCRSWLDVTMSRVAAYSAGCYLGDSDLTVRPDRIMSDAAWLTFQQIRATRDPEGRFPGYLGTPTPSSATLTVADGSRTEAKSTSSRSR
ncbi:FAD-binding protein [Micromonospora sp. NPDC005298]|uniref:FAD-binding oxidoreductase n=1 Tax=Micromonospora sp. NPDC005298 TaxID=3156873 RepID=UPI0033BEE23D